MGTGFSSGDWQFRLAATDPDAWPEIAVENPFNEPPLPGWSYVLVPVTFTYAGTSSAAPWLNTSITFLGSNNVIYDGYSDQTCGVIPNDSDNINDMYPGGTTTGNECAVVPTAAVDGGNWRVRGGDEDPERFVALR